MEFTKKQLDQFKNNMLYCAFQAVMNGILSSNVGYREEMNMLYSQKKNDLYQITQDYWLKLKEINKKASDQNFTLFTSFTTGNIDLMKNSFDFWTKNKISEEPSETKKSMDLFAETFVNQNKSDQNFCEQRFNLLKETMEKFNVAVEEFKRNAEVVIEKYSPTNQIENQGSNA